MRLSWSWPSRTEDRFESWLAQRHEDRVLAGETTPVGPCPDEAFLRNLARRAKWIVLSDSRVAHAANCPTCMSRLLVFREENRSRRRKLTLVTAVVLCSVIGAVVITVARDGMHRQLPSANVAVRSEAVNLWDASTIRGNQPGSLQSVFLPAAVVRVTIILPRFSPPGEYAVAVTQDQWRPRISVRRTGPSGGEGRNILPSYDPRTGSGVLLLSPTNQVDSPLRRLNSRLRSNPGICLGKRLERSKSANPSWPQIRFVCAQFRRRWPTSRRLAGINPDSLV